MRGVFCAVRGVSFSFVDLLAVVARAFVRSLHLLRASFARGPTSCPLSVSVVLPSRVALVATVIDCYQ